MLFMSNTLALFHNTRTFVFFALIRQKFKFEQIFKEKYYHIKGVNDKNILHNNGSNEAYIVYI